MDPSSSADFQKDPKVQSHPDAIQIHLEPRVQWDLPHLQRTATACTPSAQQSQSAHPVVFTRFPAVCGFGVPDPSCCGPRGQCLLRRPPVVVVGTPGGSRGSRWSVATCQVRRRRSWKRGRPGSSPVPEVPSQVTRSWAGWAWALCGLGSWKFHGSFRGLGHGSTPK